MKSIFIVLGMLALGAVWVGALTSLSSSHEWDGMPPPTIVIVAPVVAGVGEDVTFDHIVSRVSSCQSSQILNEKLEVKGESPWVAWETSTITWHKAGVHEIRITCEPLDERRGTITETQFVTVVEPEEVNIAGKTEPLKVTLDKLNIKFQEVCSKHGELGGEEAAEECYSTFRNKINQLSLAVGLGEHSESERAL